MAFTRPRPPLQFHFNGDDFEYTGGHYVGKHQETVSDANGEEHTEVSTEILEDIETQEHSNNCQVRPLFTGHGLGIDYVKVVCNDPSTEGSWKRFFTNVKRLISTKQVISPPDFN